MTTTRQSKTSAFAMTVGRALRRAGRRARAEARRYRTPIYVSRRGRVVAVKP